MVYCKGEIDIKKLNSNTARYFPFAYFLSAKKICFIATSKSVPQNRS